MGDIAYSKLCDIADYITEYTGKFEREPAIDEDERDDDSRLICLLHSQIVK